MPNMVMGQAIGSPRVEGIYAYDQRGVGGQMAGPMPMGPGVTQEWYRIQQQSQQDLQNRMADAIDPETGQLRAGVMPVTPSEWAEVQRQAELLAATRQRDNYKRQWDLLRNGFEGGPDGGGNDRLFAALTPRNSAPASINTSFTANGGAGRGGIGAVPMKRRWAPQLAFGV